MRIPLVANAYGENLLMTVNKKLLRQPLPFKPYLIAEKPNQHLQSTDIKMIRIPDNQEVTMFKMEADTVQLNDDKAKQLMMEGKSFCKLPYLEQLYVDMPDYPLQYPNTNELDVLYLDIEVLTKGDGIFPRAHNRPIIAIGCKHNDNPVQIFDRYTRGNDSGLLEDFLEYYRAVDPDVLVTYNGHSFDLPYIIQRMEKHHMGLDQLGRYGKFRYKEGQEDIEFNGRVHLDCIIPARKDQSLFGIKSRGLKDVSAWYGFKALSLGDDVTNTQALIGTPQLREYLESDVNATKVVADVYLPNAVALAELVQVPLGSIVGCFPSFIPKLICARHCKRLNLVPLDSNKDRYGNIKEDEDGKPTGEVEPGRLYTLGSRFQGAIVEARKFGYINKILKVDFASMYPSAIRTWNLGPDTTRITAVRDYTGKYEFYRKGKTMVLVIPDENFNKDIEVTVDMSRTGFLKEEIEKLAAERKRLKALLKEAKTKAETDAYDSRQTAVKVIMNSIFGYMGSAYANYSDMATGLTITGMCRWTSRYVSSVLGDAIVNIDTDGFIVDKEQNVGELNEKIAEYIKDNQGVTSYMTLEEEPLIDGFFYKMKNYAVRMIKKGKTIIVKHGVAFKSSKQAAVCDTIMDTICKQTLDRTVTDTYLEAMKLKALKQYPLSAFKFRVTFSKDLAGYKNGMSLHRAIGLQVEDRLKTKVEDGLQVDYYVTKQPAPCEPLQQAFKETKRTKGPYYTISQYVTSADQLDEEYYQDSINKLFAIFGWDIDPQIKIKLI
jgi:DNA polymerase elongation subunit (family B)